MRGYRGEELAESQWNDQHEVVAPGDVRYSPSTGQTSQGRYGVEGDGEELNQRHRGRVRKGLQNQLPDDIVRRASHVPKEAEDDDFDAQISTGHIGALRQTSDGGARRSWSDSVVEMMVF